MKKPNSSDANSNFIQDAVTSTLPQQMAGFDQTLLANIPGVIYRCHYDSNWTAIFLSDAIEDITGYSPSDLIKNRVRSFASIIHPEDQEKLGMAFPKNIDMNQPYRLEYRLLHADGSIRWVYDHGVVTQNATLNDETKTPSFLREGVILDITERKLVDLSEQRQTEAELSRLALVAQKTQNAVIITNAAGQIQWVNQSFTRITGYVLAEILGKKPGSFLQGPNTDPGTVAQIRAAIQRRQPFEGEIYNYNKQGIGYWLSLSITPIYTELGEHQGFIAIETDITERKRTEEALRDSESHYRYIVETASEGVWVFDEYSKTTFVNSRMAAMLGYTVEEMLGRSLFDFIDDHSQTLAQTYIARRRQGLQERHDFKFRRQDGSDLWAIVSATPLLNAEGEFIGVLRMITDISERKQAEDALQKTLNELEYEKFALDQSSIVAITNASGMITYVNERFCQISQYSRSEIIGKTHKVVNSGYHPPEFFQHLWTTITQGKVWRGEIKNKAKDGSFYWVDTTIVPFLDSQGQPYQYVAIRNDITSRKQIEEALRQSETQLRTKNQELAKALQELQQTQSMIVQNEKMASLGQLVAGIAHEINNPVSFIYGNVIYVAQYIKDLLELVQFYQQEYPEPSASVQERIEDIDLFFVMEDLPKVLKSMEVGAERIRQIVVSLRNFSRHDESERKQADIHEGLESTLLILQHRFSETAKHPKIGLMREYGQIPFVECYPSQLNQVFMNIITNGLDALETAMETGWGHGNISSLVYCPHPTISIRTELVQNEGDKTNKVVIKIADNGPGISPEIQQRLFDPFFTTKPVGKGIGLGLSISYQIVVQKHGGRLQCISTPGQGSEFIIEIPV